MLKSLSFEKRQEILSNTGGLHADLFELKSKYLRQTMMRHLPDGFLAYSKDLIKRALQEEIADPVAGAALRSLTVDAWIKNLKAMDLVIALNYVSDADWAKEGAERELMRRNLEKDLLE